MQIIILFHALSNYFIYGSIYETGQGRPWELLKI